VDAVLTVDGWMDSDLLARMEMINAAVDTRVQLLSQPKRLN